MKVFAPDCVGRRHFKPGSIIAACGDGNLQLLRLRWSRWTAQTATGVGVYHWNDCKPACYLGHFHSRPGAHVTLSRVTRCPSKGFFPVHLHAGNAADVDATVQAIHGEALV